MITSLLNWKAEKARQKVFRKAQLFSLVWLICKGGYSFQECSWKKVAKQMGRFGYKDGKCEKLSTAPGPQKRWHKVSVASPHKVLLTELMKIWKDVMCIQMCSEEWSVIYMTYAQHDSVVEGWPTASPHGSHLPMPSSHFSSVLKAEGHSVLPCLVTVIIVVSMAKAQMMLLGPSPLASFPLLSCLHPPLDQFSLVAQSCPTLCDPMNRSTPGLLVHHQLPGFIQTHVHCVGDAVQSSYPLSSPSPPAFNLSQHQSLLKWVSASHEVSKVLVLQLQHQSFQWTLKTDLL